LNIAWLIGEFNVNFYRYEQLYEYQISVFVAYPFIFQMMREQH